jgi:hypothetical protein
MIRRKQVTGKKKLIYPWSHVVGWVLATITVVGGCAAKKLPDPPAPSVVSYPYSQITDGLAVAIQPLTNAQESTRYFGTDLLSRGILAVLVSAENRDSQANFLLSKDRFALRAGQTEGSGVSGRGQIASGAGNAVATVGGVGMVVGPLLVAPVAIFGLKMISDEEAIKHSFTTKELPTKTLAAGEETHGFVYFQLPQGHLGPGQWTLHLEAVDLKSKAVTNFDFVFDWK